MAVFAVSEVREAFGKVFFAIFYIFKRTAKENDPQQSIGFLQCLTLDQFHFLGYVTCYIYIYLVLNYLWHFFH